MIKFTEQHKYVVRLDNKNVGEIRKVEFGWQYFPNNKGMGGEIFEFLADCMKDVAGEQWDSAKVESVE